METATHRKTAVPWWILTGLVVIAVMYVRLRLLGLPLERDEGEFATIGSQILSGIAPYSESFNLKPPGIYLAYAILMAVFGESAGGIHLGFLVVNLLTAGCLFIFTRARWGDRTACLASAGFLALTVSPGVLGLSAHATHFVLLPAMGGLALLATAVGTRRRPALFGAGVLLGTGVLMKQPGIFFALLGAVIVLREFFREDPRERMSLSALALYSGGVLLPGAAAVAWMLAAGVWERFWFWTVTYGFAYGSQLGIAEGSRIAAGAVPGVVLPAVFLWAIAAGGIAGIRRGDSPSSERYLMVAFLVLSFLAVTAGFHFRKHYFVLMLPAVALLFASGIGIAGDFLSARDRTRRYAGAVMGVLAAAALFQPFYAGREILFSMSPAGASREIFGMNPFVESPALAERVSGMTDDGDRILVFGSEPQIYFYARRLPATGYLYTYGLMEDQPYAARMQEEMKSQIARNRPKVILFVNIPWSWLLREESDLSIVDWFFGYRREEGYELAGIVDIVSMEETVWRWGPEAAGYRPASKTFIEVWNLPD